jgi:hypothetical protein
MENGRDPGPRRYRWRRITVEYVASILSRRATSPGPEWDLDNTALSGATTPNDVTDTFYRHESGIQTNIRQLTDVLQCKLHQDLRQPTSSSALSGRRPPEPAGPAHEGTR